MKTIKMEHAMVWWNDNEEAKDHPGLPRIAVLSHKEANTRFFYLSNSAGGCDGDWTRINDADRARRLLAIYAWATGRNGVPADEAHKEFLKIDAYRDWLECETGPFANAYID
jgi:hypothetical protein